MSVFLVLSSLQDLATSLIFLYLIYFSLSQYPFNVNRKKNLCSFCLTSLCCLVSLLIIRTVKGSPASNTSSQLHTIITIIIIIIIIITSSSSSSSSSLYSVTCISCHLFQRPLLLRLQREYGKCYLFFTP